MLQCEHMQAYKSSLQVLLMFLKGTGLFGKSYNLPESSAMLIFRA